MLKMELQIVSEMGTTEAMSEEARKNQSHELALN